VAAIATCLLNAIGDQPIPGWLSETIGRVMSDYLVDLYKGSGPDLLLDPSPRGKHWLVRASGGLMGHLRKSASSGSDCQTGIEVLGRPRARETLDVGGWAAGEAAAAS
jgi:hypothetical protein